MAEPSAFTPIGAQLVAEEWAQQDPLPCTVPRGCSGGACKRAATEQQQHTAAIARGSKRLRASLEDGDINFDVNNGLLTGRDEEDEPCCSSGWKGRRNGESTGILLDLNVELLELVLSHMDCITLVTVSRVCKLFDTLVNRRDRVVRGTVVRHCGQELSQRWRHLSWLQRLQLEETQSPFDHARCTESGFTFQFDASTGRCCAVRLDGSGPKLLVSSQTTLEVPLLRWRFELRGNNALEVGVVPHTLQDEEKALHKCHASADGAMPCGMFSTITVGSKLPVRLPLMRGSVVEMVARRGSIEVLVHNPSNGQEMHWVNGAMVPKLYRGPNKLSFELTFPPNSAMKLAATCWAKCELVLA